CFFPLRTAPHHGIVRSGCDACGRGTASGCTGRAQRRCATSPLPASQEADAACPCRRGIARNGWQRPGAGGLGAGPCRAHRQKDSRLELVSLEADHIPAEITLINTGSVTPLHEGLIPTPTHAGIHSINLKDWDLVLE